MMEIKIVTLLFVLLNFIVLRADITYLRASKLSNTAEGYLYPFPEECSKILDAFAEYASNFTKCSIQHAHPIRVCERCVEQYYLFKDKYKELLDTVVNGTSCRSLFISHDRLDAVLEFHDSISAVWIKGHCEGCFEWSGSEIHLSNDTKHFIQLFNDTTDCIVNNINPYNNNSEEVCEKCMASYLQLDEFYKSMSPDGIGVDSVCMDIVDSTFCKFHSNHVAGYVKISLISGLRAVTKFNNLLNDFLMELMNATRKIWSKSLNCCKLRRSPEIIFLCCTGIICFLPVLFYLAVRYCGPIRDLPKVLRQSRFKQSILRSVDGSIN